MPRNQTREGNNIQKSISIQQIHSFTHSRLLLPRDNVALLPDQIVEVDLKLDGLRRVDRGEVKVAQELKMIVLYCYIMLVKCFYTQQVQQRGDIFVRQSRLKTACWRG